MYKELKKSVIKFDLFGSRYLKNFQYKIKTVKILKRLKKIQRNKEDYEVENILLPEVFIFFEISHMDTCNILLVSIKVLTTCQRLCTF